MNLPFSLTEPKALILLLTIVPVVYLGLLSARARPRDRNRIVASIAIRSLILLLLVLALAGLQWISSGGPTNVVFLIDESAVEKVSSPQSVPKGQQYEVRALLKSTSARSATVILSDDDKEVSKQDLQLQPGENVATFDIPATDEGFRVLKATVSAVDDHYSENNIAASYTVV